MSIIETMAEAIWNAEHTAAGQWPPRDPRNESIALASTRVALRAIKPEDVSDGMLEAFHKQMCREGLGVVAEKMMINSARRALAAAIAAGAESTGGER